MQYNIFCKLSILLLSLTLTLIIFSASSCESGSYQHSVGGDDYPSIAYQDAISAGIDPTLYQRQINQESGWNPNAVSNAGAIGIAQIIPSTASQWNVNPWDPVASLQAAAQHMAEYQSRYGSFAKALAAYNAGPGGLEYAMQNCADYYQCLPSETRAYISNITG